MGKEDFHSATVIAADDSDDVTFRVGQYRIDGGALSIYVPLDDVPGWPSVGDQLVVTTEASAVVRGGLVRVRAETMYEGEIATVHRLHHSGMMKYKMTDYREV